MRRNVLLLQGPVGPFFGHLAEDLQHQGFTIYKINLNGGDAFFYRRRGALCYTGSLDTWPAFFENKLTELAIDHIYLFGDGRAYHMAAREVAKRLSVRVVVFEEGYLRPDYITLEEQGANGFSQISRDRRRYPSVATHNAEATVPVGHSFTHVAIYAMAYYISSRLSRRYPHYIHHRPLNVWNEGGKWILSGVRKLWFSLTERATMTRLITELAGHYFVVPLQVHCDMQITHHSSFGSVEQFIEQVIASFAAYAPQKNYLVVKHHPMDRGYRDYTSLIRRFAEAYGIERRVLYVHDLSLPDLFKHARGTVVINSTAGLSSIHHGAPVKVLGQAIYDMQGLTSQASLDEFWQEYETPDQALYQRFRAYLVRTTQLNGNFYKRLPGAGNAQGVYWPQVRPDKSGKRDSSFSIQDMPIANRFSR